MRRNQGVCPSECEGLIRFPSLLAYPYLYCRLITYVVAQYKC